MKKSNPEYTLFGAVTHPPTHIQKGDRISFNGLKMVITNVSPMANEDGFPSQKITAVEVGDEDLKKELETILDNAFSSKWPKPRFAWEEHQEVTQ